MTSYYHTCCNMCKSTPGLCYLMGLLAPKGIFHIKWTGLLVGNFERNPYQDPASCAWLEVFFTPKMYQFLTNTFLLSNFFFSLLP